MIQIMNDYLEQATFVWQYIQYVVKMVKDKTFRSVIRIAGQNGDMELLASTM